MASLNADTRTVALIPRIHRMRLSTGRPHVLAPHETTILITGETGVASALARWIHAHSRRASRSFIAVFWGGGGGTVVRFRTRC